MQKYFKIGEISKLYNIGTDSLRYYEELGILTPERSENGYRRYSLNDLWRLNVIRDLRRLDFSMERIREYLDHRSIDATEALFEEELSIIEGKLLELTDLKKTIEERLHTIQEARQHPIGEIRIQHYETRRCHMIHSGYQTDEEMDMLIKQLLNKDKNNLYIIGNNRIGSLIPAESIKKKLYRDYSSVFIIDSRGSHTIEPGSYLTVSYRGDCNQNKEYIPKLYTYAKKQNLTPSGPVLELLWIDIHQAKDAREHITELQLKIS